MTSGLDAANPALVAAFRSALLYQLAIVAAIFVALAIAHRVARGLRAAQPRSEPTAAPQTEPRARRLLRLAFGILWIFDAILQAQPKMAGGLPSQVIEPVAAASPGWVQAVANFGGTVWSYHPVQAAAASVWIQAGIGLWLLVSATGRSSRLAGLASVAWGLVVWVFGEAFGGIFAPGLTWLSGAPGAVVLYVAAGALLVLPARAWAGPRLGRSLLTGIGLFWAGMAVLQAWPGRGSWQGGGSGMLPAMVSDMAQVPQPHAQASMLSTFASFASANGFAVNLFVVVALGALGAAFVSGRPQILRVAMPAATVFCLAVWVLVQDLGVPGGYGTDPNSMIPWLLLLQGGLLAVAEQPVEAAEGLSPAEAPGIRTHIRALGASSLSFRTLRQALATANLRSLTALGAVGVVLVGAVPMAAASASSNADPIIAQALVGAPVRLDLQAPGFQLTSGESARPVSLASMRGKVVLLTFLDPVCPGCPQIAQQLRTADSLLGDAGSQVELVAVAAGTMHSRATFIRAFDHRLGLATLPDWLFLTGTVTDLEQVWDAYEKLAPGMMSGMMVHSNFVFVIDRTGRIRWEVRDAPGPATASAQSSFADLMANATHQVLNLPGQT
ncbi:MAG TPA: SCO family protein [Actinocrinis sp.]|jgi:cytochrome oxidase Cu insertion factor (SCO1/SenC/PrrC family)